MQSLLRWSIENSTPQDGAPGDRPTAPNQKLDPGIIDMILGKPDAEQMKDDVTVATDLTRSEGERLAALDHLEMLVEQIDNANDLQRLNLWGPLNHLLTLPTTSAEIKVQVLWVIGTALQNNPAAQDAYLTYEPLPTLLGFISPSSTLAVRSKAIYTISGLLKHNAPAVDALGKPGVDGWTRLRGALEDPEISVRRKTVFLLNTLLLPVIPDSARFPHNPLSVGTQPITTSSASTVAQETPATTGISAASITANIHTVDEPTTNNPEPIHDNSHAAHLRDPTRSDTSSIALEAFARYNIVEAVISAVTNPVPYGEDGENDQPDAEFEEKSLQLLYTYFVSCHGSLAKGQREALLQWIEKEKRESSWNPERWNLTPSKLGALLQMLT